MNHEDDEAVGDNGYSERKRIGQVRIHVRRRHQPAVNFRDPQFRQRPVDGRKEECPKVEEGRAGKALAAPPRFGYRQACYGRLRVGMADAPDGLLGFMLGFCHGTGWAVLIIEY